MSGLGTLPADLHPFDECGGNSSEARPGRRCQHRLEPGGRARWPGATAPRAGRWHRPAWGQDRPGRACGGGLVSLATIPSGGLGAGLAAAVSKPSRDPSPFVEDPLPGAGVAERSGRWAAARGRGGQSEGLTERSVITVRPRGLNQTMTSRIATVRGCARFTTLCVCSPTVATLTPCHKIGCKIVHSVRLSQL